MAVTLEQNPLREGLRMMRVPDPCAFVIFGATGDLTQRKIMPSLFRLYQSGLLPPGFTVVGLAGSQLSDDEFRQRMRKAVDEFGGMGPINQTLWDSFASGLFYQSADLKDSTCYDGLDSFLSHLEQERGTGGNNVFYLAIPPSLFATVAEQLGAHGLGQREQRGYHWSRLIVEKPFGWDLESARELNRVAADVFTEDEVYRIDHYLGKDTVQNILVLRFANTIFEPIWNRRYVDSIQITIAESIGVEDRGRYYEEAGALRDMIQNHGLQLLSLVAMEPPALFDARSIRDEKTKILRSIQPISLDDVNFYAARGQYGPGIIGGKPVPGYRQEPHVAPDSRTETYAAIKLLISNWRWEGIPFYIRTGKRLARRESEIAIQFKRVPHIFLRPTPSDELAPNVLAMRIQPDEGVSMRLESKLPGLALRLRPVMMDFRYLTSFGAEATEAYDRLLLDCMLGDPTLFARGDAVEASWEIVEPILRAWQHDPTPGFPNYEAGSWGPHEADELIQRDGRHWRRL